MAQKRDTAASKRRSPRKRGMRQLAGTPLPANAGVTEAYVRKLEGMAKSMTSATSKALSSLAQAGADAAVMLTSRGRIALGSLERRFSELFEAKATDMAEAMLSASMKASGNSLGVSIAGVAEGAGKAGKGFLKELSKNVTLKANFSPEMKAGLAEAARANGRFVIYKLRDNCSMRGLPFYIEAEAYRMGLGGMVE